MNLFGKKKPVVKSPQVAINALKLQVERLEKKEGLYSLYIMYETLLTPLYLAPL